MSIRKWVIRVFVVRWLKSALDKLPFNNKKTILGFLVAIVSAIIASLSTGSPVFELLQTALDILTQLDYTAVSADTAAVIAGYVTSAIGLVHKVLKWMDR